MHHFSAGLWTDLSLFWKRVVSIREGAIFPQNHIRFEKNKNTFSIYSGTVQNFLKNIGAGKIYSILIKNNLLIISSPLLTFESPSSMISFCLLKSFALINCPCTVSCFRDPQAYFAFKGVCASYPFSLPPPRLVALLPVPYFSLLYYPVPYFSAPHFVVPYTTYTQTQTALPYR